MITHLFYHLTKSRKSLNLSIGMITREYWVEIELEESQSLYRYDNTGAGWDKIYPKRSQSLYRYDNTWKDI